MVSGNQMAKNEDNEITEYSKDQMTAMDLDELLKYASDLGLHLTIDDNTDKALVIDEILSYFDFKAQRDSGEVPIPVDDFKDIDVGLDKTDYDLYVNPLRVMDFVPYFAEYSTGITGTSKLFRESVALWLISTMASFKWRISDVGYSTSFLYLNIWFMLIGKSRISHKSTIIKPAKKLVGEITERKRIENEKKDIDYWVNARLEDQFTPEALVSALNDRCWERETKFSKWGKRTHAAWVDSEFSKFFAKINTSDYMSGTSELLSVLYDGETYTMRTQTRGREEIINPYLTILGASTEVLPKMFTDFQLSQGFLNRFMYIFHNKDVTPRQFIDRMEERYKKIREWLDTLYNVNKDCMLILFDIEANDTVMTDELAAYEKFVDEEIANKDLGMVEAYFGNSPNILRQLAGLFRLSRLSLKELQDINNGIKDKHGRVNWKYICMQDYRRAKEFLDQMLENFRDVISIVQEKTLDVPVPTLNKHATILFNGIKKAYEDNNKQPVELTHINRKMKSILRTGDVKQVIEFLLSAGYIGQTASTPATGKPQTFYTPFKDSFDL